MLEGHILYGTRYMRVRPLLPDGSFSEGGEDEPEWIGIETPQQANVTPVVSQGQSQELRGGDRLLAVVQEDDEYVGMDIQFTDAVINGDVLAVIAGGTFQAGVYTPPAMGTRRTHFQVELYVARYAEGSNHDSDIIGFIRFDFPNVSGSLPSFNAQQRGFLVPQLTLRARDNQEEEARFWSFEEVASLPE